MATADHGRKMRASLTRAVVVEFSNRTDDDREHLRVSPDDGTVQAFLNWIVTSQTFPFRGFGGSGGGWYCAVFPAEDEPKIREWIVGRGIEREAGEGNG